MLTEKYHGIFHKSRLYFASQFAQVFLILESATCNQSCGLLILLSGWTASGYGYVAIPDRNRLGGVFHIVWGIGLASQGNGYRVLRQPRSFCTPTCETLSLWLSDEMC